MCPCRGCGPALRRRPRLVPGPGQASPPACALNPPSLALLDKLTHSHHPRATWPARPALPTDCAPLSATDQYSADQTNDEPLCLAWLICIDGLALAGRSCSSSLALAWHVRGMSSNSNAQGLASQSNSNTADRHGRTGVWAGRTARARARHFLGSSLFGPWHRERGTRSGSRFHVATEAQGQGQGKGTTSAI